MKSSNAMTQLNQITRLHFLALIAACIAVLSSSCSVDLQENKIACKDDNGCPKGWHCKRSTGFCTKQGNDTGDTLSNPGAGGATAVGNTELPINEGGSGAGATTRSEGSGGAVSTSAVCDGAVYECKPNECGTLSNACGATIDCPCSEPYICRDNKCVEPPSNSCSGCTINDLCYKPGLSKSDNACEVCTPTIAEDAWSPNNGALCDDGKYCTDPDKCNYNRCSATPTPRNCDDKCSCTTDTCVEQLRSCMHESKCPDNQVCHCNECKTTGCGDNQCTISKVCYDNGSLNENNTCQKCDVVRNKEDWSINVGAACGDQGQSECSDPDTCDAKGECNPNHRAKETPCGPTPDKCEEQDLCDGTGDCPDAGVKRLWILCSPAGPCTAASYCDGTNSYCSPNLLLSGIKCNDHTPGECEKDDTCFLGRCIENGHIPAGQACRDRTTSESCKTYVCDRYHECGLANNDGGSCPDDGNACTDDVCSGGTCQHNEKNCNDDKACTDDECTADGCEFADTCPTGEVCSNEGCVSVPVAGAGG